MNEHSAQPGHALAASRAVCLVGSNHGRCNDEDGGFDDRISVLILTPHRHHHRHYHLAHLQRKEYKYLQILRLIPLRQTITIRVVIK